MAPSVLSGILGFKNRLLGFIGAEASSIRQGIILSNQLNEKTYTSICEAEFNIFSQFGEDGIIQYLLKHVPIENKTFIEFGVEDFFESNCRFLMMKENWQGFVLDGSKENIKRLQKSYFYWRHDLNAKQAFIDRENINDLLRESGFNQDLGVLSIDLDGVDYYVWEAIDYYKPRILILEYNANFGPDRQITVPYRSDFQRGKAHHSNLYWGASLRALEELSLKKGYCLVGANSTGNNAFFVRKDLIREPLVELETAKAFRPSLYRESRDAKGKLSLVPFGDRHRILKGLLVQNTQTGEVEAI
jgi:hypothetical protein